MGKLTTHVLDVAKGLPAAGLRLELFSLSEDDKTFITNQTTNKDGRCEQPLAQGDQFPKASIKLNSMWVTISKAGVPNCLVSWELSPFNFLWKM